MDRSRAWAADTLGRWSRGEPAQRAVQAELPEATRLLLAGDPIERALAADALGRGPLARATADERARRAGLLFTTLRDDDYPAVRAIAWRSLRAVLAVSAPGRVPAVGAFTATDTREERTRRLTEIAAQLSEGALRAVPAETAALRAPDTDSAIFIGE